MNIPVTWGMAVISRRTTIPSRAVPGMRLVIFVGACSRANRWPKSMEVPKMTKTVPGIM